MKYILNQSELLSQRADYPHSSCTLPRVSCRNVFRTHLHGYRCQLSFYIGLALAFLQPQIDRWRSQLVYFLRVLLADLALKQVVLWWLQAHIWDISSGCGTVAFESLEFLKLAPSVTRRTRTLLKQSHIISRPFILFSYEHTCDRVIG